MVNYLRKECEDCGHWLAGEFCGRVQFGMPCVLGEFPGADITPPEGVFVSHLYAPREPAAVTGRTKPEENRFLLCSHENLANFAKDVLAQNSQLRERLAQIRELAK